MHRAKEPKPVLLPPSPLLLYDQPDGVFSKVGFFWKLGTPKGNRTPVPAVRGQFHIIGSIPLCPPMFTAVFCLFPMGSLYTA